MSQSSQLFRTPKRRLTIESADSGNPAIKKRKNDGGNQVLIRDSISDDGPQKRDTVIKEEIDLTEDHEDVK